MIVTWTQIGVWAIGVAGTTLGNIITFLIFTSVTGTKWFKVLMAKLQADFNNIDPDPKIKKGVFGNEQRADGK